MKLIELIQKCSKGYEKDFPESPLTDQCNANGIAHSLEEYAQLHCGDTLGRFIVIELNETFNPEASDEDQIQEAFRAINQACNNLQNILGELEQGV